MQENGNLQYFVGTMKPSDVFHGIAQDTENGSDDSIDVDESELSDNIDGVIRNRLNSEDIIDLERFVEQEEVEEYSEESKSEHIQSNTNNIKSPYIKPYDIKRNSEERITKIIYYNTKGEVVYIEAFNYDNITERDMVSSLYKPKANNDEIISENNLIGHRFYKNGIKTGNINDGDYLTFCIDEKNCMNSVFIENINAHQQNYITFMNSFYNKEFRDSEGRQIDGTYFRSLMMYKIAFEKQVEDIISNKVVDDAKRAKYITIYQNARKDINSRIINFANCYDKFIQLDNKINELKSDIDILNKRLEIFAMSSSSSQDSRKSISSSTSDTSQLTEQIRSTINKNQMELDDAIKNRKDLETQLLDYSEKISESINLIIDIKKNIPNLTEKEKHIFSNCLSIYFDNLAIMRVKGDYFEKIFNKRKYYNTSYRNKNPVTQHLLNCLGLPDNYNMNSNFIIMPINRVQHATVLIIDKKTKTPYLLDSSLFHCNIGWDNGLNVATSAREDVFGKEFSKEIEILNKYSIQINGCCTYWAMSFMNVIINNDNGKYTTIKQIIAASKNGQLQLDAAIEMGKIFDRDQNNPTIKYSTNENEIDTNRYIKIKIDNNNFYGINKTAFDNKFLKLEGIKSLCNNYIEQNQITQLDNLIKCQNCMLNEDKMFTPKTLNESKRNYRLSEKGILTMDKFIDVAKKHCDISSNDVDNLQEIKKEKEKTKNDMRQQLQEQNNPDIQLLINGYNSILEQQEKIFGKYDLTSYRNNQQVINNALDYVERGENVQPQLQQPQINLANIQQIINTQFQGIQDMHTVNKNNSNEHHNNQIKQNTQIQQQAQQNAALQQQELVQNQHNFSPEFDKVKEIVTNKLGKTNIENTEQINSTKQNQNIESELAKQQQTVNTTRQQVGQSIGNFFQY